MEPIEYAIEIKDEWETLGTTQLTADDADAAAEAASAFAASVFDTRKIPARKRRTMTVEVEPKGGDRFCFLYGGN